MSRNFLLGAPWSRSDRQAFSDALVSRYSNNHEAAFAYVNDVINRQIAKASGLLAYNALIFGGLQLVGAKDWTSKAAALLALGSSALLLLLLYVRWGSADGYSNAESDLVASLQVTFNRGISITFALTASVVATVLTAAIVLRQ